MNPDNTEQLSKFVSKLVSLFDTLEDRYDSTENSWDKQLYIEFAKISKVIDYEDPTDALLKNADVLSKFGIIAYDSDNHNDCYVRYLPKNIRVVVSYTLGKARWDIDKI